MPLSLLTVLAALAAVYFLWSLVDHISLSGLEAMILRALRREIHRDPFVVRHRLRDTIGLVVAVFVLSASFYGESLAHRPQTAARPSPPPAETPTATTQDQGTVDQRLQQTLDQADREISAKLQTDRQ